MTDANRRFTPPSLPASPFEVLGVNGIGELPTPRLPAVPDIQVQDTTNQNIAAQQQSMNNAFAYVDQQLQSTRDSAIQVAETTSRNNNRNVIGGITEAIATGYGIYQDLQDRRTQAELQALEIKQSDLAAAYEDEMRGLVQNLYDNYVAYGTNEGAISGYTTMIRQLRQKYDGQVPPEVLQVVTNIGWEALGEVTRTRGERLVNEYVDTRDTLRDTALAELRANITPMLAQMSNGFMLYNPEEGMAAINQTMNDYFEQSNISGLDRAYIYAAILPEITEQYAQLGGDITRFQQQQAVLFDVLGRADALHQQYSGNADTLRQVLAPLQLELNQAGIDSVTLSDMLRPDIAVMREQLEVQKQISDLTPQSGSGGTGVPRFESSEEARAYNTMINQQAISFYNNKAQYRLQIEQGRAAEPGTPERAIYETYLSIEQDIGSLREIEIGIADNQRIINEARSEIEAIFDKVDPDNRIGRPQTFVGWGSVLTNAIGAAQNPEVSQQLSRALEIANREDARLAEEDIARLVTQRDTLVRTWLDEGINLYNPADTSALQSQVEIAQPILDRMAARNAAMQQQSTANFQWGLEQLPQLQPLSPATGLSPLQTAQP